MVASMCGLATDEEHSVAALLSEGWLTEKTVDGIGDPKRLTNGDAYMILYDLATTRLNMTFD